MDESAVFKKVFGCIIGGAIGDALGAPVEGCHYKQIQETYGVVRDFVPPFKGERRGKINFPLGPDPPWRHPVKGGLPWGHHIHPEGGWESGRYTDDTQNRLLSYLSIIKYGRRIKPWEHETFVKEFALELVNHSDEVRRNWARNILTRPVTGLSLRRPVFGFGGAPAGVVNAGNPEAAAEDGGPGGAAIAEAFRPGATVDSVIQAALDHGDSYDHPREYRNPWGRVSEWFYKRTLWLLDLAEKVNDVLEIRKYIYGEDPADTFLVTFPPWDIVSSLEMLPVALVMFKIANGDPLTTIVGAVNFGRDCDSIACQAGELAGAFKGVDALPKHMVDAVLEANPDPDMKEIAEKLTQIILRNAQKQN